MKTIQDYKVGEVVEVFHWGKPEKMKVLGYRPQTNQVEMGYLDGPFGGCFYSVEDFERMDKEIEWYYKELNRKHNPELDFEMGEETDCMGNNFSDADPGL